MPEQIVKLKKKQWYPIVAPKLFGEVVLGETLVREPQLMLDKTLTQSLMNLTNDIKKQNTNVHFKIVGIEGDKGKTSIVGYEIVPSSVKRFVRRNSKKMDMSFPCETADNVPLRIKLVVVAKTYVKGSIEAKLRNNAILFLTKIIKKMGYEEFISDLISHKLQSALRETLNKIYPLKICEIRYAGIEERTKKQEAQEEIKAEVKVEVKEEK